MTAVIVDLNPSVTWGHSGDHFARYRAQDPRLLSDPFAVGTLWERVAESARASYPRHEGGVLVWACCVSSIGPVCQHRAPRQ